VVPVEPVVLIPVVVPVEVVPAVVPVVVPVVVAVVLAVVAVVPVVVVVFIVSEVPELVGVSISVVELVPSFMEPLFTVGLSGVVPLAWSSLLLPQEGSSRIASPPATVQFKIFFFIVFERLDNTNHTSTLTNPPDLQPS
jgi:hypothetical protein